MRLLLAILVFSFGAFASQSADLKRALTQFEAGEFAAARKSTQDILLSGRGEELEASLYLLARIDLALKEPESAQRGAERIIRAFPQGVYYPFARFTLAEALFLSGDVARSRRELQWCADSSGDSRLRERAAEILAEHASFAQAEYLFPTDNVARRSETYGSEHRPHVLLLLAFPDANDPAPRQLEEAFKFAARVNNTFETHVRAAGSAYRTVQLLDSVAKREVDLIVFAGDEGSATALALANEEYGLPILKITSTPHSLALLCEGMVEFLSSHETIAANSAKYVVHELGIRHAIMLTPDSDMGKANREGFRRGSDSGLELDADLSYPAETKTLRRELHDVFSAPDRLARGGSMVDALLSREERERLFGDQRAGEVSVQATTVEFSDSGNTGPNEAFFFSLSSDQINNYCSQLGNLPRSTVLVGNSSWLDERALTAQSHITDGMLIGAPLLPEADVRTELLADYEAHNSLDATVWELLGLDAAQFVSAVYAKQKSSGGDFVQAAREVGEFRGASVRAEIGANGENQRSRILTFDGQDLTVVK